MESAVSGPIPWTASSCARNSAVGLRNMRASEPHPSKSGPPVVKLPHRQGLPTLSGYWRFQYDWQTLQAGYSGVLLTFLFRGVFSPGPSIYVCPAWRNPDEREADLR